MAFIRAYRDAVRWLEEPAHRAQAQALLARNVPGLDEALAAQSAAALLDPRSGFDPDVRLDPQGVAAVMALRSKLGGGAPLTDEGRYLDRRYWQHAMQR